MIARTRAWLWWLALDAAYYVAGFGSPAYLWVWERAARAEWRRGQ